MRQKNRSASFLVILLALGALNAAAWAAPVDAKKAAALCDKLAAASDDKTNPPGIKGVATATLDGAAALAPCEAAAAAFPAKPRYALQYGRALHAGGEDQKAFPFIKSAAEAGHAVAMNYLGFFYEKGLGTEADNAKAFDWYLKSAKLGVPRAASNVGLSYRDGTGVEKNASEAEKWLSKAGDLGWADAYSDLGLMYEEGDGFDQSDAKAAQWYQRSVKAGSLPGMVNLGWIYDRGVGGLPLDHEKAAKLYLDAAKGGNAEGMNNLGESYLIGEGVIKNVPEGLKWLNAAYDAGSGRAAYNLGVNYDRGERMPRDVAKAAQYLVTALERQSTDASRALIENQGKKFPLDTINAVQDLLIKRGGKFEKQNGSFSPEAISYMKDIATGH